MRIGILTLNLHTNYGGILQAYALQKVLERMGHTPYVIRRNCLPHISFRKKILAYPYRWMKKCILANNIIVKRELVQKRNFLFLSKNINPFIEKHIRSFYIRELSDIKMDDFCCYIVGSDQVWRPKYFVSSWGNQIENAFLSFTKGWNVKRIAYAASFGTDKWEFPNGINEDIKRLVNLFEVVSVRESSGVHLCRKYMNIDAKWVLDPTLLLKKDDYENLIPDSIKDKKSRTLFCYILDRTDEIDKLIKKVAIDKKLSPFYMSAHSDKIVLGEKDALDSVENWLKNFRDATFVVTDSFHACVFSIIFNKPFIVVGNKDRGMSRFESLLGSLDLEQNLILDTCDYNSHNNYCIPSSCYEKLELLRAQSICVLHNISN